MVFSTIIFLFRFLPITLALYYLAPAKLKNTVLFLCSLVFYCWGEVRFFPVMVALILINYVCGLAIEHFDAKPALRKVFLLIALIGSLGMLFYFKYANFVLRSANALLGTAFAEIQGIGTLPLGISFYTFQTLSYSIDVYRRDVKAERNIIDFGAYVVMFPQLIAGPIVQYKTVAKELDHRINTSEDFALGCRRFCVGLAKKVLLANAVGKLWDAQLAASMGGTLTVAGGWMGLLAYGFQIYFDFSGYSDMAIGLGKMFGFHFLENFNYPYISRSITEFWRRWHISLSTWLRDYLYISLGGNRKGRIRTYGNLLLTMLLGGLWHGAAVRFILWGGLHGAALALHKLWMALVPGAKATGAQMHWWSRAAGMLLTFNIVCLGWLMFRAESMQTVSLMLHQIFENFNAAMIPQVVTGYAAVFALIAAGYILHLLPSAVDAVAQRIVVHAPLVLQVLMAAAMIWCVMQIKSSDIQPFIYFQF